MIGNVKQFIVDINNCPDELEKYTVARYVDCQWWFYGTYDDPVKAYEVANEVCGMIFENGE